MTPELRQALAKLGRTRLIDWADELPTLSMIELAHRLPVPVNPVSLVRAMAEEAHAHGVFPEFARGWAVRVLTNPREESDWGLIFDAEHDAHSKPLWRAISKAQEADPQWHPQTKDDSRLVELFEGVNLARLPRTQNRVRAFDRISGLLETTKSSKAALEALARIPEGYGMLHAVKWVDTEVRNGGFEQLYRNSRGVEVPLALVGLMRLKREDLATLVRESLAFARRHHAELVDESVESPATVAAPRTFAQLDAAYLAEPHDLADAFSTLIETTPSLFELPFRELRHAEDGRRWKIRRSGVVLEIQIVLEDGTTIARERKQGTPDAAEAEMQRLLEEQLQEGFSASTE